jgi:hypothetical protein
MLLLPSVLLLATLKAVLLLTALVAVALLAVVVIAAAAVATLLAAVIAMVLRLRHSHAGRAIAALTAVVVVVVGLASPAASAGALTLAGDVAASSAEDAALRLQLVADVALHAVRHVGARFVALLALRGVLALVHAAAAVRVRLGLARARVGVGATAAHVEAADRVAVGARPALHVLHHLCLHWVAPARVEPVRL